ncbi:hypothetical protein J1N09_02465 [Aureitalea sp. L0-47]|uniref:hypothetical protein n=1 Tax=Aureitalea sp. L0-47 TaxID=2816962 RepID=UPI002236F2F1|nr:hypothetical protein [Aureitalea sp. L0-47]MCW5518686.1 hypothetical protein [Aureitalea sp. L0-47]
METKVINEALQFEQQKLTLRTTSDRIVASRKAKDLILRLNEIYKENKDAAIMDLMKRLTVIKRKIEKRLKGRQDLLA